MTRALLVLALALAMLVPAVLLASAALDLSLIADQALGWGAAVTAGVAGLRELRRTIGGTPQ
ncbi:hypothetical protein SAMN04487819_11698 [Actinopolyspora alba]|uniref:Uncharacterized protein n=1 Tax=Actinopolyspora alba TaxID=673379 RepID=A0A1I2BGT2_9ACTN|nr:hypothetical protein [Actinopolyspora alba]SFE55385.1 hypothetical protein SAMN04487819_11698 [Actinopolyspora alba]